MEPITFVSLYVGFFLNNKHSNESQTSKKRSFIGELILGEGIVRPQLLRSRTLLLSGMCVYFVESEQQYELFKASEPYLSVSLFDFACCDPSIKEVWPQSTIILLRFSL